MTSHNRSLKALAALSHDLLQEGLGFVSLTEDGELYVLNKDSLERYQAREEGAGTNNNYWGLHAGGYEFCGSMTHTLTD